MSIPPEKNTPLGVANQTMPGTPRLILASASPRRRELLGSLDADFTIRATDAEERDDPVAAEVIAALPTCALPLADHPTLRAWRKAREIWQHAMDDVVLGADTVVVLDGTVLNKPRDAEHACEMLMQLAGRTHTVYTGLCVCSSQRQLPLFDLVASHVTIAPLQREAISAYVATGEPLDKAGAYGIQGLGGKLVQQVVGSYTAVVGLPLPAARRLLATAGITSLRDSTDAYYMWLRNQGKEPLPCPPTLP